MSGNSKSSVPEAPVQSKMMVPETINMKPTSPNPSVPSASAPGNTLTRSEIQHNSHDKYKTDDTSSTGTAKSVFRRKEDKPGPEKQLSNANDAAPRKSHNQKKTNDPPHSFYGSRESSFAQASSASVPETPQSGVTSSTRTRKSLFGRKVDKSDTEKKLSSNAKEAASQTSHDQKKTNDPPQSFYGRRESSLAQASSASVPETPQSSVSSTTGERGPQNK